ncbi:hypothetical protein RMATCC62417_10648 [Rhizopus microsporus]|nr:hypothetical protein RMATCC62417_10642 [Rhizopus microsporus]CEG75639.1 hypothetical protein RMATCC62417_10648 [Rhizopus microsporus]
MINERNLTLDHPSTDKASSNQEALSYVSDHSRQNSDATEVEVDEKAVATNENSIPQITDEEDQHDGGYGWFVVLGAFFVQVTSFGTITSWGKNYMKE